MRDKGRALPRGPAVANAQSVGEPVVVSLSRGFPSELIPPGAARPMQFSVHSFGAVPDRSGMPLVEADVAAHDVKQTWSALRKDITDAA